MNTADKDALNAAIMNLESTRLYVPHAQSPKYAYATGFSGARYAAAAAVVAVPDSNSDTEVQTAHPVVAVGEINKTAPPFDTLRVMKINALLMDEIEGATLMSALLGPGVHDAHSFWNTVDDLTKDWTPDVDEDGAAACEALSGSARSNEGSPAALPEDARRAFAIADEAMYETLLSEALGSGENELEFYHRTGVDSTRIKTIAETYAHVREAFEWLKSRGYVELDADEDGEFIRVIRKPLPPGESAEAVPSDEKAPAVGVGSPVSTVSSAMEPPIPAGQTLSAQPVASKELSDEQIEALVFDAIHTLPEKILAQVGTWQFGPLQDFARAILAASRLDGPNAGEKP